jgi:radical SAM/Cys-rich protein
MNPQPTSAAAAAKQPGSAFAARLAAEGLRLDRQPCSTLQLNLGKRCNQACTHCHVEAGPLRTEQMSAATLARVIELLDHSPQVECVDITGGAPELHPGFRALVETARGRGLRVIDRCNLTVLFEPGQEDTARFLAEAAVEIVASLPCYLQENVDQQRGRGVYELSIEALQWLNREGYGKAGSGLVLNLVYNPAGAFLPPDQSQLEARYRAELAARHGIVFNRLYTLTNMPIKRFLHQLLREGQFESYQQLLIERFNVQAAESVMCRSLVSIGFDGRLHDCDFNQMLELELGGARCTVWDIASLDEIRSRSIAFDNHCFGCTAGAGSSCGGTLT